ncbi:MAG: hypothetical protein Tsb0013_17570 [Phycisphaerales bacterium]
MPDDHAADQPAPTAQGTLKTGLSRGWVIKSLLIIVVFIGLAVWGYVDATVIYPARGQNHVNHSRLGYLEKLEDAGASRLRNASIEDPAAEYQRLDEQLSLISPDSVEAATYQWLSALKKIENLDELTEENAAELAAREGGAAPSDTKTMFVNPRQHLADLQTEIGSAKAPKPLNSWDIPSQWAFVVVGLGVGVPLLLLFLVNASRSYRFEPATKTLTLPDGTAVTPQNLTGFDKRKWDKFLVFITLAGESHERKIDLYRYTPLEEWLVSIYEASPIYEADETEGEADDPAGDDEESQVDVREGEAEA